MKTINQDTPLFRTSTCLGIVSKLTSVRWSNPVEVVSGSQRIGWGSIYVKTNRRNQELMVDIVIDYHSPERLSAEQDKIFAGADGKMVLPDGHTKFGMLQEGDNPSEFDISSIQIGHKPLFRLQLELGSPVLPESE